MKSLLSSMVTTPVIITTGTGGVGKTTMSCAIAISLAQHNNARVLVITIDPARRLASVLSEKELGHKPRHIDHSRFISQPIRGEVYAAMVDTAAGWNDIVSRYAHNDTDATRIFNNKLYTNLTTRFVHSHDFVAMDQLYEHYRSGEYDYIVLDTPPASQAFGFFDAPQAMSDFFGGKMVRLVTSPYRMGQGRIAKLFDVASQPFFALADKVLGKQFLNDIGEFFFLFHTMYDDFVVRSQTITSFLASHNVQSCMVINATQFLNESYCGMADGLASRRITLGNILINNVPFSQQDLESDLTDSEIEPAEPQDLIGQLIRHDLICARQVFSQIDSNKGILATSISPSVVYTPISRIYTTDEADRLAKLIQSVQG